MFAHNRKMLKALFDSNKDIRILLVGLNGAGKTTILHKLDFGEIDTTIPNIGDSVLSKLPCL